MQQDMDLGAVTKIYVRQSVKLKAIMQSVGRGLNS